MRASVRESYGSGLWACTLRVTHIDPKGCILQGLRSVVELFTSSPPRLQPSLPRAEMSLTLERPSQDN